MSKTCLDGGEMEERRSIALISNHTTLEDAEVSYFILFLFILLSILPGRAQSWYARDKAALIIGIGSLLRIPRHPLTSIEFFSLNTTVATSRTTHFSRKVL
jgi:hypothetical protein